MGQKEKQVQLLNQYFFSRRDIVAVRQTWRDRKTGEIISQPRPVKGEDLLDDLIAFHVIGPQGGKAPPLSYVNRKTAGQVADARGFDRLGSYAVAPDNTTVWLCLDFDGPGHPLPLADPKETLLACLERCRSLGVPAHVEKSGSGTGWHLWVFFEEPVPAADARLLAHLVAPTDQVLVTGEPADIRAGRGIECFPKQNTVSDKRMGAGNMIWAPYWFQAKDGGNEFHRVTDDGDLVPYVPDGFEHLATARLHDVLAQVPDDIRRFVLKKRSASNNSKAKTAERHNSLSGGFTPTGSSLVLAALEHISPDSPYDEWLRVGMALHSWDEHQGLALWDPWSARGDKYRPGEPEEKWDGFTSGGGITLGSLFDLAKKSGWEPPKHEHTPLPTDEEVERFMDVDPAALLDQAKSDKRREILECLLNACHPLSPAEVAAETGKSINSAQKLLFKMSQDGLIERLNHGTYKAVLTKQPDEKAESEAECRAESSKQPTRKAESKAVLPKQPVQTASHPDSTKAVSIKQPSQATFSDHDDSRPGLPTIVVSHRQLRYKIEDAWAAVRASNYPPRLFQRTGGLVRLADTDDAPVITPVGETALLGHLSQIANWVKQTNDMDVPMHPPRDVVAVMVELPDKTLPHLESVTATPVFDRDGSLIAAPGHHREARLWMHRSPGSGHIEIPESPSPDQIAAARSLILDDLLVDFPFADPSDRAHAVAALLLPFVRRMIDGPTPLHLIESPSPGTGKSLLAKAIAKIALARGGGETLPLARDDGENAKKITSVLSGGPKIITLDNVPVGIRSATLASVLTSTEWTDRVLGVSRMITLPNRALWLATANNPALTLEIARRCVRIRIDSHHDRPWLLDGFKHSPLEDWIEEHRASLIGALTTLVRAWIVAGSHTERVSFGSFDSWARVLGGILQFAEIPGFLGHLEDLYEAADLEGNEWREFTAAWWDRFGPRFVAAAALLGLATEKDLLSATIGDGGPQSQKIRLGRALSAMRDRQFGVYRIATRRDGRTKNLTYGLTDVSGSVSTTPGAIVGLFSSNTANKHGESKQPTADSPHYKSQQNQGSAVNTVSAVSDSKYAHARTHTQADGPANSPPLTDSPQTTRTPEDALDVDLSDFGPEENEK